MEAQWSRRMYYAVGALAEAHRQQGLHQASRGFGLSDHDGLMHALIQATTPAGLAILESQIQQLSINCKHQFRVQ